MITVKEVCERICLPKEVEERVLREAEKLNKREYEGFLPDLYRIDTRDQTYQKLTAAIGEDPDGMKMLTFMLMCAADSFQEYEKRGISAGIFSDTMKFCTRFIGEHYEVFGKYAFEWGWWFPRQLALLEFRIGALEYEMTKQDGRKVIHIHIPADADMERESIIGSYREASVFFQKYFPEYGNVDWVCDSWLLSSTLTKLLPEKSRIRTFQKDFEIISFHAEGDGGIRWLYQRTDLPVLDLPERTSLQRKAKALMKEGGHIGEAFGRLKKENVLL